MVQVEVEFTISHSLEELKDIFIRTGHIHDWRTSRTLGADGSGGLSFLETRTIGIDLHNEDERYAWFVFSFEACGELKRRIVIPNIISSAIDIDNLSLDGFLAFCRECLIAPAKSSPMGGTQAEATAEHVGLRRLLKNMLE